MAIPNNYIDKITDHDSGGSRPICPPAEHVQVDNENFEGDTLDEVLDEVAQAIEDAGQGGYAPPQGGIPKSDLAESVQDSLDKADSALQEEDLADYATKTELQQGLGAKQDKLQAGNGIVIAQDGKTVSVDAEVVEPATADGTFAVRIGGNTYTINLNHSHENMAKLVVDTAANLPDVEDMEEDTIYGEVDDGEISVLYVGGVPFYGGGGGGTSTPVLRQPADGSTIDVGTIESGESSVSKTITVKGKSLTQALTVAVTGTGYSVNKQSISAADANVGTTLTITCTSTADDAAGTLSLASSEVSCDCDLVANVPTYEDLRGVKLTGSQWLQTDYRPNANTEFEMRCHFIENIHSKDKDATTTNSNLFRCEQNNGDGKKFLIYQLPPDNDTAYNSYGAALINESTISCSGHNQIAQYIGTSGADAYTNFLVDNLKMFYRKGSSNGVFGFNSGGTEHTVTTSLKTSTMETPMYICKHNDGTIYCRFDLVIYELKITENGTVVRDWVPKTKNGIPGLYDTVNHTFMSSETATELVAIPLTSNN